MRIQIVEVVIWNLYLPLTRCLRYWWMFDDEERVGGGNAMHIRERCISASCGTSRRIGETLFGDGAISLR